jgi:hypothetical protein
MFSKRLLDILVAVTLPVVIGVTAREVTATAAVISRINSVETVRKSWPSLYSLDTKYIEETGTWMTYTEDGSTGVDGGVIYLLSNYRTCSG